MEIKYILLILFIPQFIYLFDYIIKSLYISYWENIFKYRFIIFFNYLKQNNKSLFVKRKTIDGRYMIHLYYHNKIYEYVGDDRGIIKVYGTDDKKIKTLFGLRYYAQNTIELKIQKTKKPYLNLISDFNFKSLPLIKKSMNIKKINISEKENKKTSLVPLNNILFENKIEYVIKNDGKKETDNDARKLIINTFFDRNEKEEINLNDIMDFPHFIRDCFKYFKENNKISKRYINDLITDKIHEYAIRN